MYSEFGQEYLWAGLQCVDKLLGELHGGFTMNVSKAWILPMYV